MPPTLQVDLFTLKVVSKSHVTWATSVCGNFSLPRPLCSRLTADVRDRQMSDRQTSDAHHRLIPPTIGAGIIMQQWPQ